MSQEGATTEKDYKFCVYCKHSERLKTINQETVLCVLLDLQTPPHSKACSHFKDGGPFLMKSTRVE